MPSRINRVPKGLLDFLGTTNQGDNPSMLSDEVRPTINLFPFLASERLSLWSEGLSSMDVAGTITAEVPDGELWFPSHASMSFSPPGNNDFADLQIAQLKPPNGQQNPGESATTRTLLVHESFQAGTLATQVMYATYTWPQLIGIGTGGELQGLFRAHTIQLSSFNFALWFYKFNV